MTALRDELDRVGIRGRLARRIELELADHLACDPEANLGEPRLIAERFAAELRLPLTRRATYTGFAGLALAAVLLAASQRALVVAHGSVPSVPGLRGTLIAWAGLAIMLGCQVAFVSGMLALWGVRRGTPPALVQRRLAFALGSGLLVVCGIGFDSVAFHPYLPLWATAVAAAAAVAPVPVLAASAGGLRTASALTPGGPVAVRPFPAWLVVAIGAAVVLAITVGSAFAERSWQEGLVRGALEAAAFAGGYLVLGRRLGIRR